jgi:Zn ribbon nucleic-acid-binding protein
VEGVIIMPRKKTHEEFIKEVYNLVGQEYTILSQYINNKTYVSIKHNKCGHIYNVTPSNFLTGKRCPICMREYSNKNRRKTHEQFIQEVYDLVGSEYEVLGKYKTAIDKIKFKHNKCGNVFEMSPNNFLTGRRCPKCGFENTLNSTRYTDEEFKKILKEKTNGECIALEKYINSTTKIKFKHLKCGNEFIARPSHVLEGHYCPRCGYKRIGNKLKKTHEQYVKEVYELVEDEYTVLSGYVDDRTKIKMKHNKCGRIFYIRAGNFLRGIRCPHCAESKGENKIYNFLVEKDIEFKREYRNKNCKNKYTLPFDFAIFDKDKLLCLIEYDGELHYKKARWNDAEEKFSSIQKTDKIKDKFCRDYKIPLIRIPYWEYDKIEDILETNLRKLSIL